MSRYSFNTIVTSQEADALKEMIFARARERAQALQEDINTEFATNTRNEIMDLARDSFVSSKNPFAQNSQPQNETQIEPTKKEDEIGFAKRQVNEIKSQIANSHNNINKEVTSKEVAETMSEARNVFGRKKSFLGALEFLNSQASIALVKNQGKTFEAIA